MAYIPSAYKISFDELDIILDESPEDGPISPETLLMVDWVYHCGDANYEDGLSFFDRLHKKLGKFHPNWNIDDWKEEVRNANVPSATYMRILRTMLADPSDIAYYGL